MSNNVSKTNRFEFVLSGQRNIMYRVQKTSLGSLNLGGSPFATSMVDLLLPSNKVDFSPLAIQVLLSENYTEWMDAVKWMYDIRKTDDAHLSSEEIGTVIVLDSNNVPIMKVDYFGCYPISITEIDYALDEVESTNNFTLTLNYDSMDITNMITGEKIVYSE